MTPRSVRGARVLRGMFPKPRAIDFCYTCASLGMVLGLLCSDGAYAALRRAKDVIIPIWLDSGAKPAAIVRFEEVFTEYERHGFFRIGLLPKLVARNATLEVLKLRDAKSVLRQAIGLIHGGSASHFEIQTMKILLSAHSNPLIRAERVRFNEDGDWLLSSGVIWRQDRCHISFQKATLKVHGASAGQFSYEDAGRSVTLNIFPNY